MQRGIAAPLFVFDQKTDLRNYSRILNKIVELGNSLTPKDT